MSLLFNAVLGDISQIFKLYYILWIGYCIKVYIYIDIDIYSPPLFICVCPFAWGPLDQYGWTVSDANEFWANLLPFGNKYTYSHMSVRRWLRSGFVGSQYCLPTVYLICFILCIDYLINISVDFLLRIYLFSLLQ